MNAQLPLTDDMIRAAIARRATSASEHDLRERVLAAMADVPQRRGWRVRLTQAPALPERKAMLTLAAAVLLLLAMAIGVAVVGSLIDRTPSAPLGGLAYISGGDLYVAGPAGESPRLVWDAPETAVLSQPRWVDAETIVINVRRLVDGVGSVYLVNITTSAPRLIDVGGWLLALSPDHSRIATAHAVDGAASHLWIVEMASGLRLADFAADTSFGQGTGNGFGPSTWSTDGRWLLGQGMRSQASATSGWIYRVDTQTGRIVDVAIDLCCGLHQPNPVLSPDGSRVVFVNYYQAAQGDFCDFRCGTLWSIDPATGARQQLTAEAGSEIGPVFSPDGRWIAFMEWVGTGYDVAVVRADGTGRRKLTETGDAFAPAANLEPYKYLFWDPDGTGLTFLRGPGASLEHELWHVTVDGQIEQRIGTFVVSEFSR